MVRNLHSLHTKKGNCRLFSSGPRASVPAGPRPAADLRRGRAQRLPTVAGDVVGRLCLGTPPGPRQRTPPHAAAASSLQRPLKEGHITSRSGVFVLQQRKRICLILIRIRKYFVIRNFARFFPNIHRLEQKNKLFVYFLRLSDYYIRLNKC